MLNPSLQCPIADPFLLSQPLGNWKCRRAIKPSKATEADLPPLSLIVLAGDSRDRMNQFMTVNMTLRTSPAIQIVPFPNSISPSMHKCLPASSNQSRTERTDRRGMEPRGLECSHERRRTASPEQPRNHTVGTAGKENG